MTLGIGRASGGSIWYWMGQIITVIAIFSALEYVGVWQPARGVVERGLHPFLQLNRSLIRLSYIPFQIVTERTTRLRQLQDLQLRYTESLAKLAELDRVNQENTILRQQAGIQPSSATPKVLAHLLSGVEPLIDVGQVQGVKEGNIVLANGVVIGRVAEVSVYQSKITLLTSSGLAPLLIKTGQGLTGFVSGDGRQVLIKEVPADKTVTVGEGVTTLGQAGVQPDLVIGKIKEIRKDNGAPTQTFVIDQVLSLASISIVEVMP